MSAQETYGVGYIRNQSSTASASLNTETKVVGKDFADYYHSSSAVGMKPLRSSNAVGTSVMKVNDTNLGSINIVTQNMSSTPDGFSAP